MKKWEYQIQNLPVLGEITGVLNRLGNDGWELIAVVGDRYYFKKEKK